MKAQEKITTSTILMFSTLEEMDIYLTELEEDEGISSDAKEILTEYIEFLKSQVEEIRDANIEGNIIDSRAR